METYILKQQNHAIDSQLPTLEHEVLGRVLVQDDPDFRARESERAYRLVAELYSCTPSDAEDRFYEIYSNVNRYSKDQIQDKE